MKLPVPAPLAHDILAQNPERLVEVLSSRIGPEIKGKYLHWDKLRHLTPPSGFTAELWWAAIRFARIALSRELPLLDDKQKPFRVSLTDSMYRRLHLVDRDAAGAIRGMDNSLEGSQSRYLIRSLIEEAMTSSQLEGAATSRAVAKEMLSTGRQPRDHSEQMIYNNYVVMKDIRDWNDRPFTPDAIMELHRKLTADTLDQDDCGRFRTAEDDIVVYDRATPTILHIPPSARELPKRLQRLCDFANDSSSDNFVHPVVRAIAIHFQIGYDHPFCDGNGRTARILFYWSMLKSGYWMTEYLSISSVIKKSAAKYMAAYLYTESDEQDLSYFVSQQLDVIEKSIHDLHAYIARKTDENRKADRLLRSAVILGENLNHRQRALLTHAVHNPDRSYTVAAHQTAHRVTYPTALNDLKDLERIGLLSKNKLGKAWHFFPVANLGELLAQPADVVSNS
jgi:Fic family protein